MKHTAIFAAILEITLTMHAQTGKQVNDDQIKLTGINRQLIKNFLNNDTVEHTKIIHSDFLFIGKDGGLYDRSEYMKGWAHGYEKAVMPEFDLEEVQVRIFDNMALVVGKTRDKIMKDGQWITGETRYTDTYVKEKGEWKCVQVQLTRMPSVHN